MVLKKENEMPPDEDTKSNSIIPTRGALPLPLHAVTAPVKRGRGRPKKINPRPTIEDLTYHVEITQLRNESVANDPLVTSATNRNDAIETLHRVKIEMAKEAATLLFNRGEDEKFGKDTTAISSKRISALREIANIELELRNLGAAVVDLKGEHFQAVFKYFLESIRETATEIFTPEQVNIFFNRLESRLDGWEERAQNLVR